jgi:epoxyqueuosine reductase QueG
MLPIEDFYVHAGMKDGRLSFCKKCVKARVKTHRLANSEKFKAYEQKRNAQPHRVAARAAYQAAHPEVLNRVKKAWIKRNPEKRAAHIILSNAVRDGKITKPTECQRCGARGRIQAHHADYTKPLEVEWLCVPCHVGRHVT